MNKLIYRSISLIFFTSLQYNSCINEDIAKYPNKLAAYKYVCKTNAFDNGVNAIFWPYYSINILIPYFLANEQSKRCKK